jgi:hypothetical protein
MHTDVKKYISKLSPDKKKLYVLISALGGGEFWGSNVNGDFFPVGGLVHKGTDYGYLTFLNGHVFKHHKNKDPNVSFGTIPLSVWDDAMKRVVLVLELDRSKAAQFEATDVVDKIDSGLSCDVSMGCKVPYDVCSICQNKSKTRDDYCTHLQNEMNQIYPDGRKVWASNLSPRFFDLSFVFIGADAIGKSLYKIASKGCCPMCSTAGTSCSVKAAEDAGWVDTESYTVKTASAKTSSIKSATKQKLSDILKEVPSQFTSKSVPALEAQEPDISRDALNEMATKHPLGSSLATPSLMGMVLKPHEYQRIILIKIGRSDIADSMDKRNLVFAPTEQVDTSIKLGHFSKSLCDKLMPLLEKRSGFGPILKNRMLDMAVMQPQPSISRIPVKDDFLGKIAAGYNGYRVQALESLHQELPKVLEENGNLLEALYHERFVREFSKEASTNVTNLGTLVPLLGVFPVLYFLAAHWRDQEIHGKKLNFFQKFITSNPGISSILAAGAIAKARA